MKDKKSLLIDEQIKKLKNFFLTDVKIINKYLLIAIILVILSCVGLTSYALFSYEIEQESNIKIVYSDLIGPTCVIEGPDASEIGINSNANYIMNCTDKFGVVSSTLTSDNFTITGDITISNIEKEQITNGYKYIIEITSGDIDTIGNIKLKENVIQDINGNYNKESNVSDNVIVTSYKIFYLQSNGATYEYHFDQGMTWNDFVNSSYNNGNFSINGSYLLYGNRYDVLLSDSFVLTTSTITKNTTYSANKRIIYKNGYAGLYWGVKSVDYTGSIGSSYISASGNGTSTRMYEGYIILCFTSSVGYNFTNYSSLIISARMLNGGDYLGGIVGYLPYAYYSDAPGTNKFTSYKKVNSTSTTTYLFDISSISGNYCIAITSGGADFYYSTEVTNIYFQ